MLIAANGVLADDGKAIKPGYTKAITSEADMAGVINRLQQPETRVEAFVNLLEFAGYPQGQTQSDDAQLNRMHAKAVEAMHACPGLDHVIAKMIQRLDEPKSRLKMIVPLLAFAGPDRWMGSVVIVGDPKIDALEDKARDAANNTADVKTVASALADPDLAVRRWGIRKFGNPLGRTEEWAPLLPQIEVAAAGADRDLRYDAISPLAHFPGTEKFLDERFSTEKSVFLLMSLLDERGNWGEDFNRKFLPRFAALLSDPDEAARDEALDFIGCNDDWAEARKVPFGRDIFDKAIEATHSKSAKERFEAVFALACIRHLDPDASRAAFLRLVNDPDENVRWRLGFCLVDQQSSKEVKSAIASLTKDKSPLVQYMTILAVRP